MADELGKHWRTASGYHIDVSSLDPPEPMVAILELIERPGIEGPIFVHHNREPVHLYPELNERGWQHQILTKTAGEVRLKLTRYN